jgi:hypothetical protein
VSSVAGCSTLTAVALESPIVSQVTLLAESLAALLVASPVALLVAAPVALSTAGSATRFFLSFMKASDCLRLAAFRSRS